MKKDKSQERLHPIDEDRRLIEEIIPIKEISEQSAKEKGIRQGHISAIHLWWARRPLAASRAAVFSSLARISKNSKEELIETTKELTKIESANDKRVLNKCRKIILDSFDGKTPKVLDPFSGGGAIPLESARLGCETYALDLNPVAHTVELATLYYPQKFSKVKFKEYGGLKQDSPKNKLIGEIEKAGKIIIEKTEKELKDFYPDKDKAATVLNYLWARTVKCSNPSCNADAPLIKQYWLSKKDNKKIAVKPICDENKVHFSMLEGKKIDFNPDEGTVKTGSAVCLCCGNTLTREYIFSEAKKGKMSKMMIAVVLTKKGITKYYREANEKDINAYNYAKKELEKYKNIKINGISYIPDELLPPKGSLGISPYWSNDKGQKRTWAELFNGRQLLGIITLIKNIKEYQKELEKKIGDKEFIQAVITYLALSLDKFADLNNVLTRWEPKAQCPRNLYNKQVIGMGWDYAESVPFSGSSGSYQTCLRTTINAVSSIPFESIEPCNVKQGTATRLPYENEFFDAVITDPPYYDAVPYSDISDLFYTLLKRTLGDLNPSIFSTNLTPKTNEIIQSSARHDNDKVKAKKWYEDEMTKAFKEANRTLKEEGIFVVVFAHKTTDAWETIVNSLLNANFVVTASWPLQTENVSRMRAQNSAALASSIFIVCRKRKSEEEGYFNEVKIELKERISKKLDQFWTQGIRGADFFISAIGPAVEVFGKYKKVRKLSGEEVGVAELLDLIREIVTDYSLQKILHGRTLGKIDDETRFYILWRWAYDDHDIPYDEARKLAQALGTEPDDLLNKKDMLEKKGDKVNLLEPGQRKKNPHLGEPRGGLPAPMIDVIHKACLLWEEQEKEELKEFIENSGYAGNDSIWNVAQAISEVLPDGNKEKQLIQGLLASKQSISKEIGKGPKQGKLGEYLK
ncbi:MAG: DUF1156 domain-containing protein [Nanoarchaeota archaeon]|nr:DUF1156 domain-containing protein [Nanoarchaeota archaeon]